MAAYSWPGAAILAGLLATVVDLVCLELSNAGVTVPRRAVLTFKLVVVVGMVVAAVSLAVPTGGGQ